MADLHLQIMPGTDTVLLQAIGRVLIENGDIDLDFVKNHTDGFDDYRQEVFETSIQDAAAICGVLVDDIRSAARLIGKSKGFLSLWAMGLNQSSDGVNKNLALINLNLITGQIGKPGSGPFSLTGQPNAMGGREVGGMATLLAAHRKLSDPVHREEIARFWGVDSLPEKPGLTATQMVEALEEGKMKAIWIICTNPLVSLPDAKRVEKALQQAKFVVVQDISSKNAAIPYADLVLPAAGWAEKEGTMTNSERRISYLEKAVDAPGEALADGEILVRFARKMGFKGFAYEGPEQVFAEHAALTKGSHIDISGLDYAYLQSQGTVQWPFVSPIDPPSTRLFGDKKFYTPNQKAQIKPSGSMAPREELSPEYPLILTTGRVRDQWHTMTRTGKVSKLGQHKPLPFLEIHPFDAIERGIHEGDTVVVEGKRGKVKVHAKVTDDIRKGVVFLPMHWGRILGDDFARANNLTGNAIDPVSKQPDFKYSVVEVSKFQKPKQKVLIIGAGAAAYRFIQTYRELNTKDEIHVFSKEKYPFYNRVLLPDYVSQHKTWEDLQKFKAGELETMDVHLYVENSIVAIDKATRQVTDEHGKVHSYDVLVIATGSRAFIPGDAPMHLPGVLTMRDRRNADDLVEYLGGKGHVMIVGGGLLGLELASSLREVDIEVTVIQLASRLMERQLDALASTLLLEKITEMGVRVFMNNQVSRLEQLEEKSIRAYLKSGATVQCNAVVYAIGTRPNSELARSAGLECGFGVKVNEYMQTSDSNVFALGEIAEFKQKLNGITAAAEQHADIAARFINGDQLSIYKGTLPMNILKFPDLDLCSIGMPEIPANAEGYEEILFLDRALRFYKKCIVYKDRLVGAILMGDKTEFADFKNLIEEKIELSDKRQELLRGKAAQEPILGKLVCSCGNVGSGNLENAIQSGCSDFRDLCQKTGAGLGCGSCKPEIKHILTQMSNLAEEV